MARLRWNRTRPAQSGSGTLSLNLKASSASREGQPESPYASYRELQCFLFTLHLMFLRVPLCVEEEAPAIFYCFFCPFGHRVDALAESPGPTDVPSAACWCIYRVTAQGPTSAPGLAALPHGVGNAACGLLGSLKGQKGCISLMPEAGRTWRWPAKSARAS